MTSPLTDLQSSDLTKNAYAALRRMRFSEEKIRVIFGAFGLNDEDFDSIREAANAKRDSHAKESLDSEQYKWFVVGKFIVLAFVNIFAVLLLMALSYGLSFVLTHNYLKFIPENYDVLVGAFIASMIAWYRERIGDVARATWRFVKRLFGN